MLSEGRDAQTRQDAQSGQDAQARQGMLSTLPAAAGGSKRWAQRALLGHLQGGTFLVQFLPSHMVLVHISVQKDTVSCHTPGQGVPFTA